MLCSAVELRDFHLVGRAIGSHVLDVGVDPVRWVVRQLVLRPEHWLQGPRIAVPTSAVLRVDAEGRRIVFGFRRGSGRPQGGRAACPVDVPGPLVGIEDLMATCTATAGGSPHTLVDLLFDAESWAVEFLLMERPDRRRQRYLLPPAELETR